MGVPIPGIRRACKSGRFACGHVALDRDFGDRRWALGVVVAAGAADPAMVVPVGIFAAA